MPLVDDVRWFEIGPEFALTVAFVVAGLVGVRTAAASRGVRTPRSAWGRAFGYFGVCWAAAWATGVTPTVFSDAPVSADQWSSASWWVWMAGSAAVIVIAYGLIWPRGTLTHGRPRQAAWSLGFGLAWGLAQGQLYLTFWSIAERIFGAGFLAGVGVWLAISAFTGIWQDQYWDRLVSPEHNIAAWNARKVVLCHVPNLVVTLTFLGVHQNGLIFVLLQTAALVLSCWFMRFPGPTSAGAVTRAG